MRLHIVQFCPFCCQVVSLVSTFSPVPFVFITNDICMTYEKVTVIELCLLLALINSVSANGYQIVISTSQATARTDINIATIQVCRTYFSLH
jgi:hypothetical protein